MIENFITSSNDSTNKVLLVDWSNLAMRNLFSTPFDPTDETFSAWRNKMIVSLKYLLMEHESDRVVFCMEGRKNWRKEYYPDYKANRLLERDASKIDFEKFFLQHDEFVESLSKFLTNCMFLRVEHAEADDLIAVLTMKHKDWSITNISTDRDFYQLYKYHNYRQFDPIKKKFIEVLNPETYLLEKVIIGDSGDNIPQLKQRVGIKTAEKIINSEEGLDEWLKLENLEKEFQRNMTLISFDFIPENIQNEVLKTFNSWIGIPIVPRDFMKFLTDNHCLGLFDTMNEMVEIFRKYDKPFLAPEIDK